MKVEVIEDAFVLIPNKDHQNFTNSERVIKRGTILDGTETLIKGKRRGVDFQYRLFLTKDKKFIHLKKTKPMKVTEVTLGADSKQTPTIVDIPATKKMFTKTILIASGVGAGVGYLFAKRKKYDKKKTILFAVGGAVAGFLIGKYIEKRKGIVIKPSK